MSNNSVKLIKKYNLIYPIKNKINIILPINSNKTFVYPIKLGNIRLLDTYDLQQSVSLEKSINLNKEFELTTDARNLFEYLLGITRDIEEV